MKYSSCRRTAANRFKTGLEELAEATSVGISGMMIDRNGVECFDEDENADEDEEEGKVECPYVHATVWDGP